MIIKTVLYCNKFFRIQVFRKRIDRMHKEYGYQEQYRWDTGKEFEPKGEIIWGFKDYDKLEKFIYDKYKKNPNIFQQYETS